MTNERARYKLKVGCKSFCELIIWTPEQERRDALMAEHHHFKPAQKLIKFAWLLFISFAPAISPGENLNLELVSQIGGAWRHVSVHDGYALVCRDEIGKGFGIFDIQNPAHP